MANSGSKLRAPGPPCSILLFYGGGGTHQESWREAHRGLSHELVASVRVGQARAITCRVLFQNSVAAFELQHAPQTTDVSFSAPVVSVYECQRIRKMNPFSINLPWISPVKFRQLVVNPRVIVDPVNSANKHAAGVLGSIAVLSDL
jgi:hypothetical protein